jgi:4-hydroxy-2-oxoheptanedioate aldolase
MTPSRVLAKMRSGGVATCTKMNLCDPRAVEIAAMCGFDCIWMDMEHVPNSLKDIENGVRAAKVHGADTLVRVRRGSYSDLILPLEMDATGIMVPHIMSLKDAQQVAWYTKFHPLGRRPVDGGNADGKYCMIPLETYLREANEQRFVLIQIEDPEPLAELEQIAALPGIDVLFFGPGDFSQGIGAPGAWDDPRIAEARKRIAKVARQNGKFAGTVGSLGNLNELVGLGYQFVSIGADVLALTDYFGGIVKGFAAAAAGGAAEGNGKVMI